MPRAAAWKRRSRTWSPSQEQSPEFQEVHVQLAALYYRLNRKEDGQREREIVLQLDAKERERASPAKP